MRKYGKVIFTIGFEKGAQLQRTLIEALSLHSVITVPATTIQKWYEEDKITPTGCAHSYVLHNKEEEDIFRTVMESEAMQDEHVKWKITRFNHDREFRKWCEEQNYVINGEDVKVVKEGV